MSHTYVHDNTVFICNSDLSGEITVQNEHGEFEIDGHDLLEFVGEFIRRERISAIEDESNERISEIEGEHPLNFIYVGR